MEGKSALVGRRHRLAILLGIALVAVLLWTPLSRAEDEFDIWTSPDVSQVGTEDIYRWSMVEVTSCWLDGSGCWTDYEDGYAGQVHWEWKVARIESTNPLYDFYAVYLLYSIGPSSWTGNPNPGSIEWAEYRTTDASVNMDLLAGQEVATYKPDTTQGSSSASYGVSVGVSRTGPDASFTASVDYTKPDVTISPHTDWNWAGFQSWSMGFGGAAPSQQFLLYFTTLVRTSEGAGLELDLNMNWGLRQDRCYITYISVCSYDVFTWAKTLRVYFPTDVTLTSATTGACQAADLAWTQYSGKYFSRYRVYYKLSSEPSWTWYATITSPTQTTSSVSGLSGSAQHDFQIMWETTYGYGRFTNVRSAASGPECVPSSEFVSQTPPPNTMSKGQSYGVSITMKNTGTTVWSPSGPNPHRLGSQNPQDNSLWGLNRVNLANSISPGQSYTFSFVVTAPSTGGTPNFQWRMIQEGVGWFGAFTPNVQVTVFTTATVEGYVNNSAGNHISGTGVVVTFPSGSTSTATTDSNGHYSLIIDALGTYRLNVQASGYTANCKARAFGAFGATYRVNFTVSTGTASIAPIRVTAGGQPVNGASVTVRNCFGTIVYTGTTNSTGDAAGVSGLTHGTFAVSSTWTDWSTCTGDPGQVKWTWVGSVSLEIPPNAVPIVAMHQDHSSACPI